MLNKNPYKRDCEYQVCILYSEKSKWTQRKTDKKTNNFYIENKYLLSKQESYMSMLARKFKKRNWNYYVFIFSLKSLKGNVNYKDKVIDDSK